MRLKQARMQAGWTQAELGAKANVDQNKISRIETGQTRHPSHRIVMRLSRALGMDPAEIDEFDDGGRR